MGGLATDSTLLLPNHLDQAGWADSQCTGNADNVIKGDVPLSALNLGYVVAMNTGAIRQLFLADLHLYP
jgi:hypothetical protein